MKTFTVIFEDGAPAAFLVEHSPTFEVVKELHRLAANRFYNFPDLADRWGIPFVLGTDAWRAAQLKRKPMLRPKGLKLALLENQNEP